MKHIRDDAWPQHESAFTCKVCKQRIEGFIYSLGDYDGPGDCPGSPNLTLDMIEEELKRAWDGPR